MQRALPAVAARPAAGQQASASFLLVSSTTSRPAPPHRAEHRMPELLLLTEREIDRHVPRFSGGHPEGRVSADTAPA